MSYSSTGSLATDLFPGDDFVRDVGDSITDAVVDRWRGGVAFRTPVARLPTAYKGDFEEWIQDRGGRTPRTMRDSWRRTEVFKTDEGHTADVFSIEAVNQRGQQLVDYVEDDTKPHLIQAKPRIRINRRTGEVEGYRGTLRFPHGSMFIYRVSVMHPGTQGVHMMRDTETEMDSLWEEIAGPVLERKEREWEDRL